VLAREEIRDDPSGLDRLAESDFVREQHAGRAGRHRDRGRQLIRQDLRRGETALGVSGSAASAIVVSSATAQARRRRFARAPCPPQSADRTARAERGARALSVPTGGARGSPRARCSLDAPPAAAHHDVGAGDDAVWQWLHCVRRCDIAGLAIVIEFVGIRACAERRSTRGKGRAENDEATTTDEEQTKATALTDEATKLVEKPKW
jgi:hypothetical protein